MQRALDKTVMLAAAMRVAIELQDTFMGPTQSGKSRSTRLRHNTPLNYSAPRSTKLSSSALLALSSAAKIAQQAHWASCDFQQRFPGGPPSRRSQFAACLKAVAEVVIACMSPTKHPCNLAEAGLPSDDAARACQQRNVDVRRHRGIRRRSFRLRHTGQMSWR